MAVESLLAFPTDEEDLVFTTESNESTDDEIKISMKVTLDHYIQIVKSLA